MNEGKEARSHPHGWCPASMGQGPLSACPVCWRSHVSRGFHASTWTPSCVSHGSSVLGVRNLGAGTR